MNNDFFYVDTHCHLDLFKDIKQKVSFEDSLKIKTITVTNTPSFYRPNSLLFKNVSNIRVALGMHPELSQQYENQVNIFEKEIVNTKYVGEIGLDGSKDFQSSFETQKKVLETILQIISKVDQKILTVHTRNAASETITLFNKYLIKTNCKIIFHWFSGNKSDLLKAISCGYFFSINHKMVKSKKGIELIRMIPISQILTETDAPFTFDENVLSRLQSLEIAIKRIAEIKKISSFNMKRIIYENFVNLLKSI